MQKSVQKFNYSNFEFKHKTKKLHNRAIFKHFIVHVQSAFDGYLLGYPGASISPDASFTVPPHCDCTVFVRIPSKNIDLMLLDDKLLKNVNFML